MNDVSKEEETFFFVSSVRRIKKVERKRSNFPDIGGRENLVFRSNCFKLDYKSVT